MTKKTKKVTKENKSKNTTLPTRLEELAAKGSFQAESDPNWFNKSNLKQDKTFTIEQLESVYADKFKILLKAKREFHAAKLALQDAYNRSFEEYSKSDSLKQKKFKI